MSDNSASRGLEGKILPFLGAPPPPPPDSDDEDGEEVASETMGFAPSLDALEVLEAPPPPPDQDELYAAPQTHLKPAGTTPTAKQRSFKRIWPKKKTSEDWWRSPVRLWAYRSPP